MGGPIWETGRILETLIQFRNSGANTSHRGKTALSPTYCHLSNGTFGVNTITECQGERSMRKNLGFNGHCPNVFMTPIAPMMNFLRVVVVDFFCSGGGCGGFGGKTNRHLSSKSRILLPPLSKGQGWRILPKMEKSRNFSNMST